MKPILFQFELVAVPSYVVMLVAGMGVLSWLCTREGTQNGLPRYQMALLLSLAYTAGLLGARLLFVVEHRRLFEDPLQAALSPVAGGFASHGALFAGLLVAGAYSAWARLPLGQVVDSAAIGLCFFGVMARVGCFLSGCCYGRPTDLPWGVIFPEGSVPAAAWGFGVALHPTQLYEAGYLTIFAFLLILAGKRFVFSGEKFLWLVFAYSLARFLNEFVRGDALVRLWNLSPPQWISLALVFMSLASIRVLRTSAVPGCSRQATL